MMTLSRSLRYWGGALAAVAALLMPVPAHAQVPSRPTPTFHRDVEPILQKACQQCHRPDSIAPMSLITYQQTRPWARAMKQRTQLAHVPGMRGVMPPWLYERNVGIQKLREDMALSDDEIDVIARWADGGAPEGDAKDAPQGKTFADNSLWFLGKPDLIV